jgi:hypothetical protein
MVPPSSFLCAPTTTAWYELSSTCTKTRYTSHGHKRNVYIHRRVGTYIDRKSLSIPLLFLLSSPPCGRIYKSHKGASGKRVKPARLSSKHTTTYRAHRDTDCANGTFPLYLLYRILKPNVYSNRTGNVNFNYYKRPLKKLSRIQASPSIVSFSIQAKFRQYCC